MQVLCLYNYGPRKSNQRLRSELHKQQYTETLYDCNHLAHVIVLCQIQKFMSYCTTFAFFYFEFDGNQVPSATPGRLYLEGDLSEVFCVTRACILEGHIDGEAYFWTFAVVMERFQTV